jgi:hypothetical protein
MGRCTVIRWAFAAGVFCCCGCSAPNSFSPVGWMSGSSSAPATAASKDQPNPLKPTDATGSPAAAAVASTGGSPAATTSSDGDKSAAGGNNGYKTAAIDPALRKLMMDELAYEPADKRQAMFDQWAKFDPAFIRELVENHRMARDVADSHKSGAGSGDWGGGAPVKTASNDKAPAAAVFDDASLPKDSVLRERTANAAPTPPAAPASAGVSPWDDPPSKLPQGQLTGAMTPPATLPQAPTGSVAGGQSAGATTPPPAPPASKADLWDTDSAPRAPSAGTQTSNNQTSADRSLLAPGMLPSTPQKSIGATTPATPNAALAASPATAGSSSTPKADAFAGLPSMDTDSFGQAPHAPAAATDKSKVAATSSPAPAAAPAVPNPFADPVPTPPSAPPAANVAGMPPASRSGQGVVTQVGGAAPLDAGVGLAAATTTAAAPPQTNGFDVEQPVKLSPPVDVPDGQVVAASDSGANGARASQVSATGSTTPATPAATTTAPPDKQQSTLASLPSRLLGAINPLPGGNGSRNMSLPANWHDELQKIVTVAATEAGQTSVGSSDAEKLAYIQKQVNLRMLYLLSGQPTRSLEPIAGLDPADQEFWQEVFWGMSSYFDRNTIADPRDRATQTIAQLRAAVHKLQEKSKLELRNVAFCNKIVNFGSYERFKRDEFTAGQPVLLYAEVENFKSEPTSDGPYRAMLKSTIEIFDARGTLVQTMPFPANEDLCASPRRDYYNSYEFSIPQGIALGPHQLKLTVEDQLSQKVASYTVNFTVK